MESVNVFFTPFIKHKDKAVSAGFIGVGIGGDRSSGYDLAKEQLFRSVEDVNPNEDLA